MTDETDATLARYEAALRTIGTPAHVPKGFDPLDWWQHRACKQGQIAREALNINAEELIRAGQQAPSTEVSTDASAGATVSDRSSRA